MTDDVLKPQVPPAESVPDHDEPEVEPRVVVKQEPESDPDPEVAAEEEARLEPEPPDGQEADPDLGSEAVAEPELVMTGDSKTDSSPESDPEATVDVEHDRASTLDQGPAPEVPALAATLRFPVVGTVPDESSADRLDDASASETPVEAPRLRDVVAAFAGWLRAVPRRSGAAFARHKLLVATFSLVCIGLVAVGAFLFLRNAQTPPDSLVVNDARERLAAPTPVQSDYALDEPLALADVTVIDKHASAARGDACDVALEVRFANAALEATATGTLTYVRDVGDAWSCTAARMDKTSYRAIAGVSTDAVVDHLGTLLHAAGADEEEGAQLAELYRDAEVALVGEHFNDELQTDSLTLHCTCGTAIMSRECDLTAHFRFVPASGAWELTEARASDDAFELGFQPLVGTWEGTFRQQETQGGKCLAARDAGLVLTIAKTSFNKDGVALIEGTLSGIAHLHDPVENDVEAHQDDERLEGLPFAGTLRTADDKGSARDDLFALLGGEDDGSGAAGIVFDCVTQDLAHGTVSLTLDFGAGDDPDGATATLTSEHPYLETFALFWTYEATARYEDVFALTKTA